METHSTTKIKSVLVNALDLECKRVKSIQIELSPHENIVCQSTDSEIKQRTFLSNSPSLKIKYLKKIDRRQFSNFLTRHLRKTTNSSKSMQLKTARMIIRKSTLKTAFLENFIVFIIIIPQVPKSKYKTQLMMHGVTSLGKIVVD